MLDGCCVLLLQDLSAEEEAGEEEKPSSLRNVNQDMQRALGALGTQEVSAGGRGRDTVGVKKLCALGANAAVGA